MPEPPDELDQVTALVSKLADRERLLHLSDADVEEHLVELEAAERLAGSWLEGNVLLLGAVQAAQLVLVRMRQFRSRFAGALLDTPLEEPTAMLSFRENKATNFAPPRSAADEYTDLETVAQAAARQFALAAQHLSDLEFGRASAAMRRELPLSPSYQRDLEAAREGLDQARDAADQARLRVTEYAARHGGEIWSKDPRGPLQRMADAADEIRRAQLRRDLAALGVEV